MDRFLHDCACAIERDATVRVADDQLPWRRLKPAADAPPVRRANVVQSGEQR